MGVYNYQVSTGSIIPDTANIRQDVINEFRQIFGQDFITDPESPEGQWIDAETTSRQSVARNNANVANQINPDLAGGPFLDAVLALTRGRRRSARRSAVNCTLTGTASTLIPRGSRARTASGDIFRSTTDAIIPGSGTLTGVPFESEQTGPIQAAVNALNVIVENILGWTTITNPTAATLGINTESDNQARNTRNVQLGIQGRSQSAAIIARVSAVPGVQSLAFRENITDSSAVIDGITLVARSIWVGVNGGSNAAVGLAVLQSKTTGSNWNGNVSESVTDPDSQQDYTVRFDRPTAVNVLVRITIRQLNTIDNPIGSVRRSILDYAAGLIEGEQGFSVGSDVSPFELSAAVNNNNPSLFVTLCEVAVKETNPTYSTSTLAISLQQIAAIELETDITVVTGSSS